MNIPSSALPPPAGLPMLAGADQVPATAGVIGYAETSGRELTLTSLWGIIWEWRWLILSLTAVGVAAAVIFTLLTTPLYRAVVTVELNPPRVDVLANQKSDDGSGGGGSDLNFVGTQLELLRSRALAERTVQDLNLAADPTLVPTGTDRATGEEMAINAVRNAIRVDIDPGSNVVTLDAISADPVLAAKIANGAAEGYINSTLERRYGASSYARNFLQRQISTVRRELENSERELVRYAQAQRLINTGGTETSGNDAGSLTGSSLVALNGAFSAAQTKRIAAEQRYREALSSGPTSEVNDRTSALRSQVAGLQADYDQKRQTFRPDYPDMVRLKSQIDSLNKAIQQEAASTRAGRAGTLRQEFEAARAEEGRLQQRVNQLSGQVLNLRGRQIRYTILQRDVDTNRSLYEALLQRYKEIGVAGGIGTANASIVDRARVPGSPFKPNIYFNLLLGIGGGLVAGLAAALLLEFVNDTIRSPDDVREKLRLAFLGGIPNARGATPVDELDDPLSSVSEAYFSLATSMQLTSVTGIPRVMCLTSTRSSEGKSTSAWALARNIARLDHSVVLIDADMRRPAFVAQAENVVGLSQLLTTRDSIRPSLLQTEVAGLSIIPAGPTPPSPPELLANGRLSEIIAEASELFDVVIIDGPPVLGLADAPLIATAAGTTIMVIEAGRTRTRGAIDALNRLRTANAHVLGAVLTRYKPVAAYGYGYNYGYGYGARTNDAYSYKVDNKKRRRIELAVSQNDADADANA